jgi:hypothetical protein
MAVTTTPDYPVAGSEVTLGLSATTGTVFGFEVQSVPSKSTITSGLLLRGVEELATPPTNAVEAAGTEISPGVSILSNTFTPDVAGEYTIVGYDIRQILGFPAFSGDPSGETRYELVGTQVTTIQVGQLIELPIITIRGDGANLQINCNETTVRAATLTAFANDKSRSASLTTAVQTAMNALVGVSISALGTQLQAAVNDLRDNFNNHIANIAVPLLPATQDWHQDGTVASPDTVNTVFLDRCDSMEGAVILLNKIRGKMLDHFLNSSSSSPNWHHPVGSPNADDLKNLPVTEQATDVATATVLASDMRYRAYERHRVQAVSIGVVPLCHVRPDTDNVLTAPASLDNLIVAFLDELETASPTAAVGEPQGVVEAENQYGFR